MRSWKVLIPVVLGVATALTSVILLNVAGSQGESYEVPGEACSVPIGEARVDPLLPPGEDLRVEEEDSYSQNPALVYCHFSVDGELALVIEVNEFSEPFDIMQRYDDHPGVYGIERAEEATIAGEPALVGPDGALVQVGCPARGEEAVLDVNVRYQGTWEDPAAGQRDVVAFTENLVGSLLEHFSCADAA